MHLPLAGPSDALRRATPAGEELMLLAQKLSLEYAGACGCGDIVLLLQHADDLAAREHQLAGASRLATCEAIARRLLTDRLAVDLSGGRR